MVTIATSETDGYKRFMRSAKLFDLDVEVCVQVNLYVIGKDFLRGVVIYIWAFFNETQNIAP